MSEPLVPKDTPYHKKYHTFHDHSLAGEGKRRNLDQYRAKVADDMANVGLGLPFDKFLDKFLPSSLKPPSLPLENPFEELKNAGDFRESKISESFTTIVNDNKLTPGYKIATSENKPDKSVDSQKQDAALFREDSVPTDGKPNWGDQVVGIEFKTHSIENDPWVDKNDKWATAEERKKVRGQLISYAELVFAVQQRVALFTLLIIGRRFRLLRWDRSGTIVSTAVDYFDNWEKLCTVLWRLSQLSDEDLGYDNTAVRLKLGDADYELMDKSAEPCAEDISHEEGPLAKGGQHSTFKYVRTLFKDSLQASWPRYRVEVPDGKDMRSILIGKPNFRTSAMAGRGTRGYVGLDTKTRQFVWLKDAWRAHYFQVEKEGDIFQRLKETRVPNVPTLVCHGDIVGQETLSPTVWAEKYPLDVVTGDDKPVLYNIESTPSPVAPANASSGSKRKRIDEDVEDGAENVGEELKVAENMDDSASDTEGSVTYAPEAEEPSKYRKDCPLRLHQHYRLVVSEVALPLSNFTNGRQLVVIIFDCLLSHYEAVENANIIHRDVSGGNILILPKVVQHPTDKTLHVEWNGLLADWELAKSTLDTGLPRKARQPERTGTWQFLSVNQLLKSSKVVTVTDELESFFYVLLYYAVRYLQSNLVDVGNWVEDFFDSYTCVGDVSICGWQKSTTMYTGRLTLSDNTTRLRFGGPMDQVLSELLSYFHAFYRVQEYHDDEKAIEALNKDVSNLPLPPPPSPSTDHKPVTERKLPFDKTKFVTAVRREDHGRPARPTRDVQELAEKVHVHQPMMVVLDDVLESQWPEAHRKAADRIPPTWKPKRGVAPTITLTSTKLTIGNAAADTQCQPAMKKLKASASDAGTSASVPLFSAGPSEVRTPTRQQPGRGNMFQRLLGRKGKDKESRKGKKKKVESREEKKESRKRKERA